MTNLRAPHLLRPGDQAENDHEALRRGRRRAILMTCTHAVDTADAVELIAMLGLDPREGRVDRADEVELTVLSSDALNNFNAVGATTRAAAKRNVDKLRK